MLPPVRPAAVLGLLVLVVGGLLIPDAALGADATIDTSSRTAVADAWSDRMAGTYVDAGWTGSVAGCHAGHPSAAAQTATLSAVNFVRSLAGLHPVALDATLSRKAQRAALITKANGAISHAPPKSWHCWSRAGARAAARSNLAWTSEPMTSGTEVEMYADDEGTANESVVHRRWLLDPEATTFGSGLTDTTGALWVRGATDPSRTGPTWVPWPSAGWFPSPLEPEGRWSLSSDSMTADFSAARVVVRSGGTRLPVTVLAPRSGYGHPTLVFQVSGLPDADDDSDDASDHATDDSTVHVAVRGIRGAAKSHHSYTVRLFTP